ncbi:MAG: sigma-70 family RNA polymerase sigma factor [Candidatus Cloacimonetes bacterium]|nr:sigma-70 family RNA polymerase sigma factor [Candidatus Cloacimonadota bacterium]
MKKKIETDADKLKRYHKLAYNLGLYKIGSIDVAEDIASQTIYSYLLKRDKIETVNHEGWIINTSKNYCHQYFDKIKAEIKLKQVMQGNVAQEIQTKISESINFVNDERDDLIEAVNFAKSKLTQSELQTYILYIQCETNLKSMVEITGESNEVLRQRVSRINRKIKAETYKKLGMIATKKILSPQINDIVRKFILRFKKNLENNTLNKMFYYFSKKDISDYHPKFEIKEVLEYEVDLDDSVYTIHVVFTNKQDESESFYFTFTIDNNALKVLQPPTPHQEHFQVSVEEGEMILRLLEKYPEDGTGIHIIPDEELEKIKQLLGEREE